MAADGSAGARSVGLPLWIYRRRFRLATGEAGLVVIRAGVLGLSSTLFLDKTPRAHDWTPTMGPESVRNHRLETTLADGRRLAVEAGYISIWSVGIAVRVDGVLVHESHPGREIRYPARFAARAADGSVESALDFDKLKRNGPAIAVDVASGIIFFAVAKLFDLTTAAFVGAGLGLLLVVVQRFVKVDLLGGLALFGIVMLLLSAGFAAVFQDEEIIKLRSTYIGLVGAVLFLTDGLLGGRYLGERMSRYLVYADINRRRLALSVGIIGVAMAGLNWLVAKFLPTDVWLLYTTFGDFVVAVGLFAVLIEWSRDKAPAAEARG